MVCHIAGFPQMQGQGQVSLTFDRVVTSDDVNTLWHKRPFNIEQDTLEFRPVRRIYQMCFDKSIVVFVLKAYNAGHIKSFE